MMGLGLVICAEQPNLATYRAQRHVNSQGKKFEILIGRWFSVLWQKNELESESYDNMSPLDIPHEMKWANLQAGAGRLGG